MPAASRPNEAPPEPSTTPVPFTSLDAACDEARTREVAVAVGSLVGPAMLTACLPWDSAEAKARIGATPVQSLPLILFDRSVEQSPQFQRLRNTQTLVETGDGYRIADGRLRPASGLTLLGRDATPNHLDLFVMSLCPFGQSAQRVLADYLEAHPDRKITVRVHYIVNRTRYGVCALHGEPEITENVRQLVIQQRHPDRLRAYLAARQSQPFEAVAAAAGLKPEDIVRHERQGSKLLERDAALTEQLGIGTSPTFVWDNQRLIVSLQGLKTLEPFSDLIIPQQASGGCGAGGSKSPAPAPRAQSPSAQP